MTRTSTALALAILLLASCTSSGASIGLLYTGDSDMVDAMLAELENEGWVAGENLELVTPQWASTEDLPAAIDELLAADVDLVVAIGAPASRAFVPYAAEHEIPLAAIALENHREALSEPFVTGLLGTNAPGRTVELARQAVDIDRLLVPVLDDAAAASNYAIIEEQVSALGVEVVRVDFATPEGLAEAIRSGPDADAVLNAASASLAPHFGPAIEAATERGIPFLSANHRTDIGAFLGYGWVNKEVGEDLARWVADLLDGTQVDDLPFGAFRLSLSLNLDTADTLGIDVPQSLLNQAAFTYP